MSMRSLESAICWELRRVTNKHSLRVKDIQEWSTGPVKELPDETRFWLPLHGVNVAVKSVLLVDKRKKAARGDKP